MLKTLSARAQHTALKSEIQHRFTVSLSLYDVLVNSVRYREDGRRDDWMIGDLYVKHQALSEPLPRRIEVTAAAPVNLRLRAQSRKLGRLAAT